MIRPFFRLAFRCWISPGRRRLPYCKQNRLFRIRPAATDNLLDMESRIIGSLANGRTAPRHERGKDLFALYSNQWYGYCYSTATG
jgi:hypothetical protein